MHGQKDNIAELLMFRVVDHLLTSYKENQTTELTFYDVASQSITMLKVKTNRFHRRQNMLRTP